MTELRIYQEKVIEDFNREVAAGKRRIIVVAATGSGKTIIAAAIIKVAVANRKRVLVLAHRREIIAQTSQKLQAHGIPHGIIQAGVSERPLENVQVASIQTLHARAVRSDRMQLPDVDVLIIDEAHHTPAASYRAIIDAYPDAILLGLTATPCRGDGRGLGRIFEVIIECPQVAELIEQGYLVKTTRLRAGQSRSEGRAHRRRRLQRGSACRPHGSPKADRRCRHPLAQYGGASEDRRVRGQRRAFAASAR